LILAHCCTFDKVRVVKKLAQLNIDAIIVTKSILPEVLVD